MRVLPMRFAGTTIAALSAVLALGACATNSQSSGGKASPVAEYSPVSDVPIPSGTKINTEKSLILGMPANWVGKIVLDVDRPTTQAVTYYQQQMPTFGWEQVTEVQGKISVITYIHGDRAATVTIAPGLTTGSDVTVTVSPRSMAVTSVSPVASKALR